MAAPPTHSAGPTGTQIEEELSRLSSSLTRRAGGDRMDSSQSEADETSGNETPGGIRPTGWRAWNLEQVLVLGGFVSMVLAVVVLVTADPSFAVGLVVVIIPGIIFTGLLLWRPRPWIYPIAGVANCLLGIIALPIGLLGALGNPLVGPVYSSVVLATLSILLALPAGIIGYLRGQKILRQRTLAEGIYDLHPRPPRRKHDAILRAFPRSGNGAVLVQPRSKRGHGGQHYRQLRLAWTSGRNSANGTSDTAIRSERSGSKRCNDRGDT